MLGFTIAVAIGVFIVGTYEIYKHIKAKKQRQKQDNNGE